MFKLALLILAVVTPTLLHAQAAPTAFRTGDLQAGVSFSLANSDYTTNIYNLAQPTTSALNWHGYGAYINLDLRYHLGLEFDFHTVSGSDPTLYERTFEIGGRYLWPIRNRFVPYGKALAGRGIFNFAAIDSSGHSTQLANIGYNTQALGGGLDLRLRPGLNLRLFDYEYQHWDNFPPNKLNPQVISFGVAYHFHGPMSVRR